MSIIPAQLPPNLLTGTFFSVEATNSSGDSASGFTVTLTATVSVGLSSGSQLCRYTGVDWDCSADSVDVAAGKITRRNVTQFSDWVATQVPTALDLAYFTATQSASSGVSLQWTTEAEWDVAGYNVYRSAGTGVNQNAVKVNAQLIAASGVQGQGASYTLLDDSVGSGNWLYTLEEVDIYGRRTLHGPVAVTVTVPTAITLIIIEQQQPVAALWLLLLCVAGLTAVAYLCNVLSRKWWVTLSSC
jgi:hypothetical protein